MIKVIIHLFILALSVFSFFTLENDKAFTSLSGFLLLWYFILLVDFLLLKLQPISVKQNLFQAVLPGDIVDFITINEIKLKKLSLTKKEERQVQERQAGLLHFLELQKSFYKVGNINTKLTQLLKKLYEINAQQWELENQLRIKNSEEAALAARRSNLKRVEVKNEINTLFKAGKELKLYQNKV